MSSLEQQLSRWRGAGILDEETSNRIAEFERRSQKARSAQPILIELFVYLGLVIVGAGVVVLVAVNWEQLSGWARVAVLAVPGLAVLPVGRVLTLARAPGLRRGGGMGWLLSLTLLSGSVGVACYEIGWNGGAATLAAGMAALPLAAILWTLNREHLQVIGLAAGTTLLSIGLAASADSSLSPENTIALLGGAMLVLFGAGAGLVRMRTLRPKITAGTLSLLGLAVGAFYFSAGLAGRLEEYRFAIAFGGTLMVFSLGTMAGTRLGLLTPRLLSGILSQLGVVLSSVVLAVGVADVAGADDEAAVFGVMLGGFAAAMIALAESEVLTPRLTARLLGCAGLVAGSLAAGLPDGPIPAEGISLVVGAGLVVLSLNHSTFVYMAGGMLAIFVGLVTPVARHVDDPTIAALLMIGIGLVLLAAVALLARYRPWSRVPGGPPAASRPAGAQRS